MVDKFPIEKHIKDRECKKCNGCCHRYIQDKYKHGAHRPMLKNSETKQENIFFGIKFKTKMLCEPFFSNRFCCLVFHLYIL